MTDSSSQRVLGDSYPGSFQLSSSADSDLFQSQHLQAFCGDVEGWGPISPFRFDLTPCFLDIGVAVVAGWGLLMGAGAIWFLLKKRIPQPVTKNWHFYAKLVSLYHCSRCIALIPCEPERLIRGWRFRSF